MKTLKQRLKIKLKIAFSFYQIATKVGETYMVVYPESVEATLEVLSFVNLELDGLGLPLACVSLGSFRAKLSFMMGAPAAVLLLTKLVGWVRRDRDEVKRELSLRETRVPGRSSEKYAEPNGQLVAWRRSSLFWQRSAEVAGARLALPSFRMAL